MNSIAFFDVEVGFESGKILDIGCIRSDEAKFHKNSTREFFELIKDCQYLCGHNIIQHDLKVLQQQTGNRDLGNDKSIDTLFLSPLLFPKNPYHRLLKDDKIQVDDKNNPFNDAIKARELFLDEVEAFQKLSEPLKVIFFNLLGNRPGYSPFFRFIQFNQKMDADKLEKLIKEEFRNKICEQSDLNSLIHGHPVSLAYALAETICG